MVIVCFADVLQWQNGRWGHHKDLARCRGGDRHRSCSSKSPISLLSPSSHDGSLLQRPCRRPAGCRLPGRPRLPGTRPEPTGRSAEGGFGGCTGPRLLGIHLQHRQCCPGRHGGLGRGRLERRRCERCLCFIPPEGHQASGGQERRRLQLFGKAEDRRSGSQGQARLHPR